MLPVSDKKQSEPATGSPKFKIDLMKLPYGIQKSIIYSLSASALSRLSQTNTYFDELVSKCNFRGRVSSIAFWHYKYPSNWAIMSIDRVTYSDQYSLLITYLDYSESKTVFFQSELPEKLFNIVTDRLRLFGGLPQVERELLKRLKQYNLKANGLCTELLLQSIPEAVSIVDCSYLRLTEGEEPNITASLFENVQNYNLLGLRTDIPMRYDAFFDTLLKWKAGELAMPVISYILVIVNAGLRESLAKMKGKSCKSCVKDFDCSFEFENFKRQRGVLMLQKDKDKECYEPQIITVLFGVGADDNIEKHYKNCIYYTKLT